MVVMWLSNSAGEALNSREVTENSRTQACGSDQAGSGGFEWFILCETVLERVRLALG